MHQFAMGKKNTPGGKKQNHKISKERKMLLIPNLKGAFIGKDNSTVALFRRKIAFCHNQFFITKYDRTDAGKTGLYIINFCFHFITIPVKPSFHQRPWPGK